MSKIKNIKLKRRPKTRVIESIKYFESIRDRMLELENELAEIKNSQEYKRNYNRLSVAKNMGQIDCIPSYKNRYRTPIIYSAFIDEEFDEDINEVGL